MSRRRLLYLDAGLLSAVLWRDGNLREEAHFRHDDEGVAAFSAYLKTHSGCTFHLLADVADEGFRIESLPCVHGADRRALLARKLGQHFDGSPLAAAISLGREKSGRRDETVLFSALTRPQLFEPWLEALRDAESPLAAIHSPPLLGPLLLRRIEPARAQCLLVTFTRAGMRQSFLADGQIRFSRLAPLGTANATAAAAACAAESARTCQYLQGRGLIAGAAPLGTVVLVHPAQTAAFLESCRDNEELQFQIVDLHALGRRCGLKSPPADSRSEALFLHLLARQAPRAQFAPATARRFFRLRQARLASQSVGAAILLGCLLFSGKQLMDLRELRQATATAVAQTEGETRRYAAIVGALPPLPTSAANLRSVIDRFEELEKRSAPLETLFAAASRSLQRFPGVSLDRIDWTAGSQPDEAMQQERARNAAGGNRPAAGMHSVALLHCSLPGASSDGEGAQLETLNRFVSDLRADNSLGVTLVHLPFGVESGKPPGSSEGSPPATTQAKFVVQISRTL